MKKYIALIILIFPWSIRKKIYQFIFKYQIHSDAYIGLSWIYPDKLILHEKSKIGHLNICKNIDLIELNIHGSIGSLNLITGFPLKSIKHFSTEYDRKPQLILKEHAAITNRHYIDCTNKVIIGKFTTVAGIRSQLLTHSVNIGTSRQESSIIEIGDYCFVGTSCVILKGTKIPNYCILGAMSLGNKHFTEPYVLYGGIPAKKIQSLDKHLEYFKREQGFIL
jgi:hypothetical protein